MFKPVNPAKLFARVFAPILFFTLLFASNSDALAATTGAKPATKKAPVIEEIVVTARRVRENVERVPLTVTVVTPLRMKQQNITRTTQLMYTAPSLTVTPLFNTLFNNYSIRGLPTGVATYFDDSPCCTGNGSVPYMDIKSIQVLNGPQGTLFGRSSAAGSVLISPMRPNLDETGGSVNFTFGDYGRADFTGIVNKPLITNELGVRLAVNTNYMRGYTNEIGGSGTLDQEKSQQLRLGIEFDKEKFQNYTAVSYIRLHPNATNLVLVGANPNFPLYNLPAAAGPAVLGTACAGAVSLGLNPDVSSCITQRLGMLANIKSALIAEQHRLDVGGESAIRLEPAPVNGQGTFIQLRDWSVLDSARYDIGDVGPLSMYLKDIFSYESNVNNTAVGAADGIGGLAEMSNAFTVFNPQQIGADNTLHGKTVARLGPATKTANNDLNVHFSSRNGLLEGTLGYFYTRTNLPSTNEGTGNIYQIFSGVLNPDLGSNSAVGFSAGGYASERAWYGQATFDASTLGVQGLKVTLGYRKSWDSSYYTTHPAVYDLASGSYSPSSALTVSSLDTSGYNYLLTASEQFTPGIMGYITQSRAYVPGGINTQVQNGTNLPNYKPIYGPEIVIDRELGGKFNFDIGDMPVRLNAAIYHYDFNDIVETFTGFTGTASIAYSANVAAARLKGFEFSGIIKPSDSWEISFGYNFNDAHYTKWTASDPENVAKPGDPICSPISQPQTCLIDLTNNPFANMPKQQGHVTVSYFPPMDASLGQVTLSASAYAQSLVWYIPSAARQLELLPNSKATISQTGYAVLNLRAAWNDVVGSKFDVALFVNNATDRVYKLSTTAQLLTLGFAVGTYAPPRMMGFEISRKF